MDLDQYEQKLRELEQAIDRIAQLVNTLLRKLEFAADDNK